MRPDGLPRSRTFAFHALQPVKREIGNPQKSGVSVVYPILRRFRRSVGVPGGTGQLQFYRCFPSAGPQRSRCRTAGRNPRGCAEWSSLPAGRRPAADGTGIPSAAGGKGSGARSGCTRPPRRSGVHTARTDAGLRRAGSTTPVPNGRSGCAAGNSCVRAADPPAADAGAAREHSPRRPPETDQPAAERGHDLVFKHPRCRSGEQDAPARRTVRL